MDIIQEQLGRSPKVPFEVAAWCGAGHPLVIRCYPLERRGKLLKPFPTLYWLTCPKVIAQVGRIEADGWIGRMEIMLRQDEALRAAVSADHDRYIEERWTLLSEDDRLAIKQAGMLHLYEERGVAGLGNRLRIKCLHAHYAFHRGAIGCGGGVVGAWMEERFGVRPCDG